MNVDKSSMVLSSWANAGFGVLGISFALFAESNAILLDGLFSFLNFAIGLISVKVVGMIALPPDNKYNFGYANFEALLKAIKGLVLFSVCSFAGVSALLNILDGGRQMNLNLGLYYSLIAGVLCFVVAFYHKHLHNKQASELVYIEYKNFIIDGWLSAIVGIAIVVVMVVSHYVLDQVTPYVDSVLTLILIVFIISFPIKTFLSGIRELLNRAPSDEKQKELLLNIQKYTPNKTLTPHVMSFIMGKTFYVMVYFFSSPSNAGKLTLTDQEIVNASIEKGLTTIYPNIEIDISYRIKKE